MCIPPTPSFVQFLMLMWGVSCEDLVIWGYEPFSSTFISLKLILWTSLTWLACVLFWWVCSVFSFSTWLLWVLQDCQHLLFLGDFLVSHQSNCGAEAFLWAAIAEWDLGSMSRWWNSFWMAVFATNKQKKTNVEIVTCGCCNQGFYAAFQSQIAGSFPPRQRMLVPLGIFICTS